MTAPNEATGVWPLSSAMAPLGVLRTGPGCARANVRFTLAAWNFGHFAETAELVVSEMVTNAVEVSTVHGSPLYVGGRMLVVWVRLFSDGFRLIIEVVDQAPASSAPSCWRVPRLAGRPRAAAVARIVSPYPSRDQPSRRASRAAVVVLPDPIGPAMARTAGFMLVTAASPAGRAE
jgi:hypothetical protein